MKKHLMLCLTLVSSLIGAQASANSWDSTGNYSLPCDTQCNSFFSGGNVYLGGFTGGNFVDTVSRGDTEAKLHAGYAEALVLGYQYNSMRVEAEVAYRWNEIKKAKFKNEHLHLKANVRSLAYMANVYYDIYNKTRFTPYLGIGLGLCSGKVSVKFKDSAGKNHKITKQVSDHFAWQAIAGVSTKVSENINLGIEYRCFAIGSGQKAQSAGIVGRYYF